MKMLRIISWGSLGLLVLPSVFYMAGQLYLETMKTLMTIATLLWFGAKTLDAYLASKLPEDMNVH